jgi:preprotein translocase subunit SecG
MSLASIQTLLLVVQLIIALALVVTILLQRSEGGALGVGGGQGGFLTARGAGDVLTRSTAILGTLFVINCLALAIIAGNERTKPTDIDAALKQDLSEQAPVPGLPAAPAPGSVDPSAPAVPVAQ